MSTRCNSSPYSRRAPYYVLRYRCCCLLCSHTEAPAHPDAFARASTSAGPRGGRASVPLACTHAHVPTARSGAETDGTPAIPTLIRSDEKIDIQRRQPQQDECSTRYIGCIAVYIHRSPRRSPAVARVLVVHSSARTDAYPVSKNMYLVYCWRYWCVCCVHTPLARRCSPAIARPPPDLLAVRSSITSYQLL